MGTIINTIDAPDEIVDAVATSMNEDVPYRKFPDEDKREGNSNSGATGVAAESEKRAGTGNGSDSFKFTVFTPGKGSYSKITFNPDTGEVTGTVRAKPGSRVVRKITRKLKE